MKCLLVTSHYKPLIGGALTVYDALASHAGGAIEVLTAHTHYIDGSDIEGWQEFDEQASYTIHRIKELQPVRDREVSIRNRVLKKVDAWQLNRVVLEQTIELIDQNEFDTICIGALDALGWLGEAVKKQRNVKVALFIHGEEVSQTAYSARAEKRRQQALSSADAVFAVSNFTANLLAEKYHVAAEKITLQTNGVDLRKYDGCNLSVSPRGQTLPKTPYVFSCGRLVERKGFDMLIEAWPEVAEKYPELKLVVGGDGPLMPHLQKRCEELHITNSVELMGWVPEDSLSAYYGNAELFIMANRTLPDGDTEGFGLVFLEAAAMGVTSIGGCAGGVRDAILDGVTGRIIKAEIAQNIAESLLELLGDDEQRVKLAEQAKAHAQTQGWQQKTEDFVKTLSNLDEKTKA